MPATPTAPARPADAHHRGQRSVAGVHQRLAAGAANPLPPSVPTSPDAAPSGHRHHARIRPSFRSATCRRQQPRSQSHARPPAARLVPGHARTDDRRSAAGQPRRIRLGSAQRCHSAVNAHHLRQRRARRRRPSRPGTAAAGISSTVRAAERARRIRHRRHRHRRGDGQLRDSRPTSRRRRPTRLRALARLSHVSRLALVRRHFQGRHRHRDRHRQQRRRELHPAGCLRTPFRPSAFRRSRAAAPASRPSGSAGSTRPRPWSPTPPNAPFSIRTSSCTRSPPPPTPAARPCCPPAAPVCRTTRTATRPAHPSNRPTPAPELDESRLHRLAVMSPQSYEQLTDANLPPTERQFGGLGGDRRRRRDRTRRRRATPHRSGTRHPRDSRRARQRLADLRRTVVRARRSASVRQVAVHAARASSRSNRPATRTPPCSTARTTTWTVPLRRFRCGVATTPTMPISSMPLSRSRRRGSCGR